MITAAQKVRLGAFLAVSIALLVGTLAVLLGVEVASPRDVYTIRYTVSLSGLEPGAPVKFNGVRVGRVDSIRIDREDVGAVLVTVSLDRGTPVKKDTRAVVNLTGITGLKYIELTGGTKESGFLAPGDRIEAGESLVDRLTGKAEDIAIKAEAVLGQVHEFLSDANRARIEHLIEDADDLLVSARTLIEENRANVAEITARMSEAGASLASLLRTVDEEMGRTLRAVRAFAEGVEGGASRESIARIVGNVEAVTSRLRQTVEGADLAGILRDMKTLTGEGSRLLQDVNLTVLRSRENLFASLAYLREALENFSEFARSVREDPSLLLRGTKEMEREMP